MSGLDLQRKGYRKRKVPEWASGERHFSVTSSNRRYESRALKPLNNIYLSFCFHVFMICRQHVVNLTPVSMKLDDVIKISCG